MPIPPELHASALSEYSAQEEKDYQELNRLILAHLRSKNWPFVIPLADFTQSAIDRTTEEVHEAGFVCSIEMRFNSFSTKNFPVMCVNRPKRTRAATLPKLIPLPVSSSPPPYSTT